MQPSLHVRGKLRGESIDLTLVRSLDSAVGAQSVRSWWARVLVVGLGVTAWILQWGILHNLASSVAGVSHRAPVWSWALLAAHIVRLGDCAKIANLVD